MTGTSRSSEAVESELGTVEARQYAELAKISLEPSTEKAHRARPE